MKTFEEYKNEISNKKIVVLGIGISNLPLIDFLNSLGAYDIFVCDKGGKDDASKKKVIERCNNLKNEGKIKDFSVGVYYLHDMPSCDIIFRSPGVRPDNSEIIARVENGARVTSEMQEFLNLCPCKIIAVTGSDGKTTTTTLIYEMLNAQHMGTERNIWVGGNIGTPLLSKVFSMKPIDFAVLELSSFQLMDLDFAPNVAVITNISPNHLDWHKSYEEYIDAKKNIYKNGKKTILVTNANNAITKTLKPNGELCLFSINDLPPIFKTTKIKLLGNHNIENYAAAYYATKDFITDDSFKAVAKTFNGVEHRIEFVRELSGVKYYNSSIDSSPNRTINTLSVFKDKSVIMLAGGKDKGIPYDDIGGPINKKVKKLVLCGPTAKVIEEAVKKAKGEKPEIIHTDDFTKAVNICKMISNPGDVVLLSPASTSFDRFNNFEERGNLFKNIVKSFN